MPNQQFELINPKTWEHHNTPYKLPFANPSRLNVNNQSRENEAATVFLPPLKKRKNYKTVPAANKSFPRRSRVQNHKIKYLWDLNPFFITGGFKMEMATRRPVRARPDKHRTNYCSVCIKHAAPGRAGAVDMGPRGAGDRGCLSGRLCCLQISSCSALYANATAPERVGM